MVKKVVRRWGVNFRRNRSRVVVVKVGEVGVVGYMKKIKIKVVSSGLIVRYRRC